MLEEHDQTRTVLQWDVAIQIELAVTEFEAAWRKGGSTEIEGVLQRHSTVPTRELFCALLETELELRQANGEVLSPQKWEARFPQWRPEIEQIFTQSQATESLRETNFRPLPNPGDEFGRYRIQREVGRGAMGVVFEAAVIATGEVVAIKVLRLPKSLAGADRDAAVRRFQTEASATAALRHPHVIQVLDVGEVDGMPYFAMPLIGSGTLKQLRREAPIESVRAAHLIEAAARALHQAHRAGLVHRDIKPSNLLLGPDDHVFVSDFGISMHRDELGRGPNIAGTPLYMSPEQSAGSANLIDGRSDVFSLGIVLYELLTGTHPFDTPFAASAEILDRICHLPVPPLRQRSEIPRRLEDICLHALRRQPEDRYSTAGDFADDLRSFIDGATKPQQPNQNSAVDRFRVPMIVGLVGVMLVGLAVMLNSAMKPPPQTPQISQVQPSIQSTTTVTPPTLVDPDRAAAEWLLSQKPTYGTDGIRVWVRVRNSWSTQLVVPGQSLPDIPFLVHQVQALHVPAITGESIERFFVPLRELENLDLDANRDLSSQDLVPVTRMKQLKKLGLAETKVSGSECLAIFSQLPALSFFSVSSEQFTDDVAEFARTTPNISQIWIRSPNERQVRQLLDIKRLTHVILFGSTGFVEADLGRDIADRWPEMDNLGLGAMYLTDNDMEAIARLPKLKTLTLSESMFSDTGLLMLQTCTSLRDLSIIRTKVTEASIRCLHVRLPQCRIHWDGGTIEPTIRSQADTAAAEQDVGLVRQAKQRADELLANLKQADEPTESVWESFRFAADSTLRTELIHRLARDAIPVARVLARLQNKSIEADERTALLLALGEYNAEQFSWDQRAELHLLLSDWYVNSPSPVVHSAIDWLARRWDREASQLSESERPKHSLTDVLKSVRLIVEQKLVPRDGGWYQPLHGPAMVVVPLGALSAIHTGEPEGVSPRMETESPVRGLTPSGLPNTRSFAIATTEITEREFHHAHETWWVQPLPEHPDRPKANLSWQEAAWFCNRFSDWEGIPPTKQCYEQFTDDNGEPRFREKPNALDLPGYRLPTTEEWEFANRAVATFARTWGTGSNANSHVLADVATEFHFGRDASWLGQYANPSDATDGLFQFPGLLKPNDFGLFDTLGNVAEWLHEPASLDAERRATKSSTTLMRTSLNDNRKRSHGGIRLARTIPPVVIPPDRLTDVFVGPAVQPDEQPATATSDTTPDLEFVPFDHEELVSLGTWPRGRVKARRFRITNLTDEPVAVVKTYQGGLLDIRDPPPKTIAPRATVEFTIAVRDTHVGTRSDDLVLRFRSGDRESAHVGKVVGNVHGPILKVFEGGDSGRDRSSFGFSFEAVPLNSNAAHRLGLFNPGDEPLQIHSIEVPLGIILDPGWTKEIAPGQFGKIPVHVDTTKVAVYSGKVRIRSNDPVEPVFEFPIHAQVSDSPRFSVIGVFRDGRWLFDHNRDGQADEEISFGKKGDRPVTGDVNGDGLCDIGVCRGGIEGKFFWEFHLRGVQEQPRKRYLFGRSNRIPLLTDPLGKGIACPTIVGPDNDHRSLLWEFDTDDDGEPNKEHSYRFGDAKATPVAGDWDGDGITDAGSFRPGDAASGFQAQWKFRVLKLHPAYPETHFGGLHAIPVTGDWDADGRSQVGLLELFDTQPFRVEFLLDNQNGWHSRLEVPFGRHGDVPVVLFGKPPER